MAFLLAPKAKEFLSRNPTLIGTVAGVAFYEDPTRGDEVPMIAIVKGKKKFTEWYEMPEIGEVNYWLND